MKDFVNVKPKYDQEGESIWEIVAAGIAAIILAVMIALLALLLSV